MKPGFHITQFHITEQTRPKSGTILQPVFGACSLYNVMRVEHSQPSYFKALLYQYLSQAKIELTERENRFI